MANRRQIEVLTREGCEDLLSRAEIGRVVLTEQAMPTALPVNFAFDGHDIIFRSDVGSKLAAAENGTVVAFEVDEFEPALRVGWSVVATGIATTITDPVDLEHVTSLGIGTWVDSSDAHYVRVRPEFMSGRRISINRHNGIG
jgi:nitroimidazol reductase NimA-like FMN-containing flavoprotein (pyridoxamine 5'-phosphate oxidase superfamily)